MKTEAVDTNEPFGAYRVICDCGEVHTIKYFGAIDKWQCKCGEWYYADPAARIWGTQALINAGMLSLEGEHESDTPNQD